MFHKIWVITKEQIAEMLYSYDIQRDSWRASLLKLFWYFFETENLINLYKNITQLHLLLLTPPVWEMWTHVSVKWSGLRQKTGNLFIWTKRATKMDFIYWRGNQWS